MTHKRISGVVFDLDGTLLDTLDDIAAAMNTVLKQHDFPVHPVDAYRFFVGDGIEMLVERTLPAAGGDSALVSRCVDEFRELYHSGWNKSTRPYDGILTLLDELEMKRLSKAVLSNKPHEITTETIHYYFSSYHFDACIGTGIFPKKPDPEAAFYIATVMGIDPDRCLYVGDTKTDMQTAQAAGMPSVGVTWGFRGERELRENGARWIVGHPTEILDIVDTP